jgi:hypothetical protein
MIRHGGKEGLRRVVDWLELIVFLLLFCYVYQITPRAQEFASRATTDIIKPNSRDYDKEKVVLVLDIGLKSSFRLLTA